MNPIGIAKVATPATRKIAESVDRVTLSARRHCRRRNRCLRHDFEFRPLSVHAVGQNGQVGQVPPNTKMARYLNQYRATLHLSKHQKTIGGTGDGNLVKVITFRVCNT